MLLLVSVRDAEEAHAAVQGGADIVDAKEPRDGALAPVAGAVLREIIQAVDGRRRVSAALGDASGERRAEREARRAAAAGVSFVKLGLAGTGDATLGGKALACAARGARARDAAMIAVAYADWKAASSLRPETVLELASAAAAAGLLIDTADKDGPSVCALANTIELEGLAARAHARGLLLAVAGKLGIDDVEWARALGADIVGVRGAACDDGRTGRVSARRVAALAERVAGAYDASRVGALTSSALRHATDIPAGSTRSK